MKRPTRVPLTPEQATQWSRKAHLHVIEALMAESLWTCRQVAFHGGTSLHLSWQSPRFSEDLDFLLTREVEDLDQVMARVLNRVQEQFLADDPRYVVEMQDKTRDAQRMPVFQLGLSHPEVVGKQWVKVEFWRVTPDYLADYATTFRTPMKPGDMVGQVAHQVPAADLESAFCDKLTAFATRPFLKWRDIFDLWWIGTQTQAQLDLDAIIPKFRHHLSAYQPPEGCTPVQALQRFLDRDPQAVIAQADPDLRRWLPPALWNRLHPDGVVQMVAYAREVLGTVAQALDGPDLSATTPPLRLPRQAPGLR